MSEVKGPDLLKQYIFGFPGRCFCTKLHTVDPLRARIIYVQKPDAGDCNGLAGVYGEHSEINKAK